ncbi:RICIN domain-containing protein [Amycolatopsis sp. NPDC059657]|uniref:RICIN domain-containing protein n=1 Tax=Amycolatopsis sp. NPDC059657 TaxID=3346899 RepID=UPI00366D555F
MRNVKGLVAAAATSAAVLGLLAAPSASAADAPKDHGKPVTSLAGLKLIPSKAKGTANRDARAAAEPQAFLLTSTASGRCLDADTGTLWENGTTVALWDCDDTAPNQGWYFIFHEEDKTVSFVNLASGRVLDADLDTFGENGTKVQLWDRNDWDNQRWALYSNDEGKHLIIQNVASGQVLDADGNTLDEPGTRVQLWDYYGAENQIWE